MSSSSSVADSSDNISRKTSQTSVETAGDAQEKIDFARWRPKYHLMAPRGWMNDPCAPTYDAETGLYHVFFQWNPNGPDWGDISWGWATSKDLVSWDISDQTALTIDRPYDCKGVFTGCMMPTTDRSLTAAYTSVSLLPVHHTLPHPKGSESLSMAKSVDGGKTWIKLDDVNPVLPSEPHDLDVTGWRDPFVSTWPRMCEALGRDQETTLFGIISGGMRNVTPTTFLYAIDRRDLTRWEYVGPLIDFGLNLRPSRWSGDLGRNWEVTNFTTLADADDPTYERDFIIMGTEGCLTDDGEEPKPADHLGPSRPVRGQLWMSGSIRGSQDAGIKVDYDFGGHLDHGAFYAANSFFDSKTRKHIVWGWIPEDDLCDDFRAKQGWSGLLCLPREITIQTLRHVVGALRTDLGALTSFDVGADVNGTSTVRTLSSKPVDSVVAGLREGAGVRHADLTKSLGAAFEGEDFQTQQWELDCSMEVSQSCRKIGIVIEHSRDSTKETVLTFDVSSETFTVDRPSFSCPRSNMLINSCQEKAPHTLFTQQDPVSKTLQQEPLRIQIWRDQSALEIFLNDRTAISSRIFAGDKTHAIRFFSEDDLCPRDTKTPSLETSTVLQATLYDGIGKNAAIGVPSS